ncbi:DegT/DnrJ/EryC1/StrS family aminotransferase [Streptomyces chartreusis]|uniref:DegT/DnrJ/EryC1/StrS family aminotransferase n=1 Tax=Streptomyces chartreusis TaxID=1969 RepID=UPI0036393103
MPQCTGPAQRPQVDLALAQLGHFATTEHTRRRLWRTYQEALASLDGVMLVDVDVDHAVPHLCQVRIPHRDQVFTDMRAAGIGVGVQPPQPRAARVPLLAAPPAGHRAGRQEILSLPFHQHLTERDIEHVVIVLGQALQRAGGPSCATC